MTATPSPRPAAQTRRSARYVNVMRRTADLTRAVTHHCPSGPTRGRVSLVGGASVEWLVLNRGAIGGLRWKALLVLILLALCKVCVHTLYVMATSKKVQCIGECSDVMLLVIIKDVLRNTRLISVYVSVKTDVNDKYYIIFYNEKVVLINMVTPLYVVGLTLTTGYPSYEVTYNCENKPKSLLLILYRFFIP